MRLRSCLAAVIMCCLYALPVVAAELPFFVDAKITSAEWESLRTAVDAVADADCQDDLDNAVHFCSSKARKTVWVFTLAAHSAHPAVVQREVVRVGERLQVRSRGYFAGSEAAFAAWFVGFAELDRQ